MSNSFADGAAPFAAFPFFTATVARTSIPTSDSYKLFVLALNNAIKGGRHHPSRRLWPGQHVG